MGKPCGYKPLCYRWGITPLCLLWFCLAGCFENTTATSDHGDILHGLRLDQVLGDVQGQMNFLSATGPREFKFPVDHGPHPGFRSEWWYLTSVLSDGQGHEFGVQYTLFRQALSPQPTGEGPWHTGQAYLAHLAVTDVSQQQHHSSSRFVRGHPQLAGVELSGDRDFRAYIEEWDLSGEVGVDQPIALKLQAGEHTQFNVLLEFTQSSDIVLQGDGGWSQKGPDAASYYYSVPRLMTTGTVSVNGRARKVSGLTWLDREWSTSVLGDHLLGWDWFALQLNDGRNLMVFNLRRVDGERDTYNHGIQVPAAPTSVPRHLQADDYRLKPLAFWRDSQGSRWPVRWQLELVDTGEILLVEALVEDQLMEMGIVYWEGIVGVTSKGEDVGRGYMELTGYRAGRHRTQEEE